jgi:N-acetylglucosaminyldiphosphoundecaprenol N-acetyl-beta-D-mannosaminyltransferase
MGKNVRLIKGRDLFEKLLAFCSERKLKVFLLGASKEVNSKSVREAREKHSNLEVEGMSGPRLGVNAKPVTKRDRLMYSEVLNSINKFKPDVLFVAFGAPKQEMWVADNWKGLNVGGIMVVGGSLDYFSGRKRKPFGVLNSFEWVWRMATERGHVKRVVKTLVLFPWVVIFGKVKFDCK